MNGKQFVTATLFALILLTLVSIPIAHQQGGGTYDPWLDYNGDGKIDIYDLKALASAYGTSGTPHARVDYHRLGSYDLLSSGVIGGTKAVTETSKPAAADYTYLADALAKPTDPAFTILRQFVGAKMNINTIGTATLYTELKLIYNDGVTEEVFTKDFTTTGVHYSTSQLVGGISGEYGFAPDYLPDTIELRLWKTGASTVTLDLVELMTGFGICETNHDSSLSPFNFIMPHAGLVSLEFCFRCKGVDGSNPIGLNLVADIGGGAIYANIGPLRNWTEEMVADNFSEVSPYGIMPAMVLPKNTMLWLTDHVTTEKEQIACLMQVEVIILR